MRVKEIISELFVKPNISWEWTVKNAHRAKAEFTIGDVKYFFSAVSHTPFVWEVEFRALVNRTQRYGITGTGKSAIVMSTIVDIMRDFLSEYNGDINQLVFTADEESRRSLYRAMIKRLLPTWEFNESETGEFRLSRPTVQTEAMNMNCFTANFKKCKQILNGEYTLTATPGFLGYGKPKQGSVSKHFRITASTCDGEVVGIVEFDQNSDALVADSVHIQPAHRRKGIATAMYKFAKELGNDISPSQSQTGQGKDLWSKLSKTL